MGDAEAGTYPGVPHGRHDLLVTASWRVSVLCAGIAGASVKFFLPAASQAPALAAGAPLRPLPPPGASKAKREGMPIDRRALVARWNPVLHHLDIEAPLSVGNGEFAFTADVTGLQTFPEAYEQTIPLATLSQWAWHTSPNPRGWSIDTFPFQEFDSHGRKVGYADAPSRERTPETDFLRTNPHRLHLGRVGFRLLRANGEAARAADLTDVEQSLDLFSGAIRSHFRLDQEPVDVETLCHPNLDLLAVRVVSPLLRQGRIGIEVRFPYPSSGPTAADWTRPEAHQSRLGRTGARAAGIERRLEDGSYEVALRWSPAGLFSSLAKHKFLLAPDGKNQDFQFVIGFSRGSRVPLHPTGPSDGKEMGAADLPDFLEVRRASSDHWRAFWMTGGAIDLSLSKDPRWRELERRIVLSEYLTAIQCAGSFPPQETGLTFNSWGGKFHLEMHWWHAAHFALWNRVELLERSLGFYTSILPRARATAKRQGYAGARWPKMTDPSGAESPSSVGPFLIWQQPHPIYYAELCYRAHPDRATLDRFEDIVRETAQFMASYPAWDAAAARYVLGPPLQGSQEIFPKDRTFNPTFELTYWRWGLETAQKWRERRGLPREGSWDEVLRRLSRPAVADGKYLFAESAADTYTDPRWARDHPSVAGAFGMLNGPDIDPETMRRTLGWIWGHWNWAETWGWDYPMLAMCAARLGEPERAVDALLLETKKNSYRANGHNHQRPGLTIYLPGNGGLLCATAMMAAGWDGAPRGHAPGFPDNGQWSVRWEGLSPMP